MSLWTPKFALFGRVTEMLRVEVKMCGIWRMASLWRNLHRFFSPFFFGVKYKCHPDFVILYLYSIINFGRGLKKWVAWKKGLVRILRCSRQILISMKYYRFFVVRLYDEYVRLENQRINCEVVKNMGNGRVKVVPKTVYLKFLKLLLTDANKNVHFFIAIKNKTSFNSVQKWKQKRPLLLLKMLQYSIREGKKAIKKFVLG